MYFNLRRILSVTPFLPFWSFQSLRQNCRGLSQGGSSLSGALSGKGRRSAGQSETFALTQAQRLQPALVAPWGFGRLGGYHIFTWMNCTLQLLLCTRNPKVLTLKIKFSLSSCFSPLFSRVICFSWQGLWTRVYLFMEGSHGVAVVFLRQSLASRASGWG